MDFKTQAASFLVQIQNRKRNPVKAATVSAYQSDLNVHILPALGDKSLAEVENGTLKTLVAGLSGQNLAASTITGIISLVKQVVSSAVDTNGNELFPRTWNSYFIDSPVVNPRNQKAPTVTAKGVSQAISRAFGQEKALYALLAGTGLRIGEALTLRAGPDDGKGSFWVPESGTLTIRTTLVKGGIQDSAKTQASTRLVDLTPELNVFLQQNLTQSEGLLFKSQVGGLICLKTAYKHLRKAGVPNGFHAFRRFRCTYLESVGVPRGLAEFWTGHAAKGIHALYIKFESETEIRKQWAAKAGLGFQLETA